MFDSVTYKKYEYLLQKIHLNRFAIKYFFKISMNLVDANVFSHIRSQT
jgi:hypothetical protein